MPRQRFQRLPAERQTQILEAAAREFAAHGYEGASLNHILEEAGVSKGAAYYYFDDKPDLYLTVLEHYWEQVMGNAILEIDKFTAGNFWDQMDKMYRGMFSRCCECPWIMDLARSVWKLSKETREGDRLGQVFKLMQEWFGVILKRGHEVGAIRTDLPDDLIIYLLVAIDEAGGHWLIEHWNQFQNPAEEALQIHLKMLDMVRKILEPERDPA